MHLIFRCSAPKYLLSKWAFGLFQQLLSSYILIVAMKKEAVSEVFFIWVFNVIR